MAAARIDIVRRVVAAVPPAGDTSPLLRLAAQAAKIWHAELSAVLVEDRDLAHVAGLSVARHYVAATARSAPLTGEFLRLAHAAARSRAEALLGRLFESSPVAWHLQAAAEAAPPGELGEDDLLLMCPHAARAGDWLSGALDSAVPVAVLLLEGAQRTAREVAVVHDGSAAGQRALALAARLAGDTGATCHVLLPHDALRTLAPAIGAAFGITGIRFSVEPLAGVDAAGIADALRQSRAGMLLLPATADTICRLQALLQGGEA